MQMLCERVRNHRGRDFQLQRPERGRERTILLHALFLKARQNSLDGTQESFVPGVLPRMAPGADIESAVPREILSIHRPVLEVRRVPVEAAGLVIGNLMFPNAKRELAAGL